MYGYPDADEDYSPPPIPDNDVYLGRVFAKKGSFTKWQVVEITGGWNPFRMINVMDKNATFKANRRDLAAMEEIYF